MEDLGAPNEHLPANVVDMTTGPESPTPASPTQMAGTPNGRGSGLGAGEVWGPDGGPKGAGTDTVSDAGSSDSEDDILLSWLRRVSGDGSVDPKQILFEQGIITDKAQLAFIDEALAWDILRHAVQMSSRHLRAQPCPAPRQRLPHHATLDSAINLIRSCTNIMVLTGAGISVSCGIPDFRSADGLYKMVEERFQLPDPQALFDIHYFVNNPEPFFQFAKELYPGNFTPSPSHRFIRQLEVRNKLLRNYTQNIDTLEQVAGIENALECHGSFRTATCFSCKAQVTCEDIREEVMKQEIPYCKQCNGNFNVVKPDIVFFGEGLPSKFGTQLMQDREEVDLLIVMGSSLRVRPVCTIPARLPASVPQILINRERVGKPHAFDIELLGNCDAIVQHLCERLHWDLPGIESGVASGVQHVGPNTYLFDGAAPLPFGGHAPSHPSAPPEPMITDADHLPSTTQ